MKNPYIFSLVTYFSVMSLVIFGLILLKPKSHRVLILPEEICQAGKGDHMQLYIKNDTAYLEFANAKNNPEIQGQQFIIGDDLDYKQDTIKETLLKVMENKDTR